MHKAYKKYIINVDFFFVQYSYDACKGQMLLLQLLSGAYDTGCMLVGYWDHEMLFSNSSEP